MRFNDQCAKKVVVAIVENKGKFWIGTNWCSNPQPVCPRLSSDDYTKCKIVCEQNSHAEIEALHKAGDASNGGILHIIGHNHCCDDCKQEIKKYGIKQVIIWNKAEKEILNFNQ